MNHIWKSYDDVTYDRLDSESITSGDTTSSRCTRGRIKIAGCLLASGLLVALGMFSFRRINVGQNYQSLLTQSSHLQVPTNDRLFMPSETYFSGRPWTANIPQGGGYVTTPGRDEPDANNTYVVSMWHQLHCLAYINEALFPGGIAGNRDLVNLDQSQHLRHCIEYMSNAVLCAGDTTLERATVQPLGNGKYNYFVGEESAWGTLHQCRDTETIETFVAENSVSNYAQTSDNHNHQHM